MTFYGLLAEFDEPARSWSPAARRCATPATSTGTPTRRSRSTAWTRRWASGAPSCPFIVLGGGLTGLSAALLMIWWMNAVDYPFVISGKPLFGLPAAIPITFELTVLFSAFATFFGMWLSNGLPRLEPSAVQQRALRTARRPTGSSSPSRRAIPASTARRRPASWPRSAASPWKRSTTRQRTEAMPRLVIYIALILAALTLVPLSCIVRAQQDPTKRQPRIQIIPDMDAQPKFKPQSENPFFPDGRAMRLPVEGTVARGQLDGRLAPLPRPGGGQHLHDGLSPAGHRRPARARPGAFPDLLRAVPRPRRRRRRHRAQARRGAAAGNLDAARRPRERDGGRRAPVGHLFGTITDGIRNMPAYGDQIPVDDRWAIVAYVRALQRARNATLADVPEDVRRNLR